MVRFGPRALVLTLPALVSAALLIASAPASALGQAEGGVVVPQVKGYVTAVQAPDSFEVNNSYQVHTTPQTTYSWTVPAGAKSRPATPSDIEVGTYVWVKGPKQRKHVKAESVLIENGAGRQLKGFGVIVRVLKPGPEPVYEADGYRIRIAPAATRKFIGKPEFKTLADVRAGDGIFYEGKREAGGELLADRADFYQGITGDTSAAKLQREAAIPDAIPPKARLIDADGEFIGPRQKVRMGDAGGQCGWHRLSKNAAFQERVWRVGMRLVPAYQKKLPFDARERIRFRFYVVDDSDFHDAFSCERGLILVPDQVVERMKTDDELAAVLAGAVAAHLSRQGFEIPTSKKVMTATAAGSIVAAEETVAVEFPWAGLAEGGAGLVLNHEMVRLEEEQWGRGSLALMDDAGYDPWAAPEAWRLLAPKKLPAKTASLPYPDLSEYMLSILHLQYKQSEKGATGI